MDILLGIGGCPFSLGIGFSLTYVDTTAISTETAPVRTKTCDFRGIGDVGQKYPTLSTYTSRGVPWGSRPPGRLRVSSPPDRTEGMSSSSYAKSSGISSSENGRVPNAPIPHSYHFILLEYFRT